MYWFEDSRIQSCHDIFDLKEGQVNVSYARSTENVVAWHGHNKQIDQVYCVKGSFKFGLGYQEGDERVRVEWKYLSDKSQTILTIPPGIWHGYRALEPDSILLYYLNEKYDESDVFKSPVGAFGEKWETPNK